MMLSPSRRVCFYVFNLFACQQAFAKLNSIKDISLRAHYSNIFEIVINMFYAPFVRMFNVFMCSFGLLVFRVFLCVFHVSACKHVRLTCAQ